MTRKDYVLIASTLKTARDENMARFGGMARQGIEVAAEAMADALANENPRFDRERFLRACGL